MSRRPRLTLSAEALVENFERLSSLLGATNCGATVKADAYGIGIDFVAPVLCDAGCEVFFVAYLKEAIKLRTLLPRANIYIFHGVDSDHIDLCKRLKLTPIVNSVEDLHQMVGRSISVAIHIDSGLNRLGIPEHDFGKVYDLLPQLSCDLFMSHLACADEPNNPQNQRQLRNFQNICEGIRNHVEQFSFANTAGIFLGRHYHFDLARPGIGLYGGSPDPKHPQGFAAVVSWHARVLEIQLVKKGERIGYGGSFKSTNDMFIATLGTGYADGYLRALSHHSEVVFDGCSLPVVGRVSMDLITVDISPLKIAGIPMAKGDWVEIMGNAMSVDTLAARSETIGYEFLTRLGSRFEKKIIEG